MKIKGNYSESSRRWLNRQASDIYVLKSKKEGYRARSAFKLIEINEKYSILNTARKIVDLGAAPGGWSQVAYKASQHHLSKIEKIIAVDLLNFDDVGDVVRIIGDFNELSIQQQIISELGSGPDLVLSDMAPFTIGHKHTDHLKIMALLDEVHLFITENLEPHGNFVAKIFHGGGEREYAEKLKKTFKKVDFFKPKSSRSESSEIYIIAIDFVSK